jgi:hypothetical protein
MLCGIAAALMLLTLGCRADAPVTPPQANAANAVVATLPFDNARAFEDLKAQCAFGPRVPGTKPHAKCADYIVDQLGPNVDEVRRQRFTWHDPHKNIDVPMTNIFGIINPTAARKVMLCAHWDTRPTADQDFTVTNRSKPILGANDGASGVAVLLELARQLHEKKPDVGVILAFWDGEDWGPGEDAMYIGARHFAAKPEGLKPAEAVLIDMIGQKDVVIPLERTSTNKFPKLTEKVWSIAAKLGYAAQFPQRVDYQITDDHDALIAVGIPTIDLIDFNYAAWHTLEDTPDKCSPDSLGIVGKVLGAYVLAEPAS